MRAGHFPRAPSAKMRALTRAVGVILTFGSSFSCSSSSQTVTAPSISKCQVTAVAEPATFGAAGGAGTLTVNTNRECQWNAGSITVLTHRWLSVVGRTCDLQVLSSQSLGGEYRRFGVTLRAA